MSVRTVLKSLKEYFSLRAAPEETGDYNYDVKVAPPQGLGNSLKNYFDLYSGYKNGDKLAGAIMKLANDEGVAKGHFDSSSMTRKWGYSFSENDFSVKLEGDGRVLLKCDAAFAEKVGKLASVGAVVALDKKPDAPAAQPEAPKP